MPEVISLTSENIQKSNLSDIDLPMLNPNKKLNVMIFYVNRINSPNEETQYETENDVKKN